MAWLSEQILFELVRLFYRTEVAHSSEMKKAQSNPECHDRYRTDQVDRIIAAANRYGVDLSDKELLDLGCNDGAITHLYPSYGVKRVVGIDIDAQAIGRAVDRYLTPELEFRVGSVDRIPVDDSSIDTIICFDVFEHVSSPAKILEECHRVLRPGGKMLIGTWGWYHPFAPHLWATMPVPWAHVFFSERTILRTCRRVFHSPWYVTTRHDLDESGHKLPDKYLGEEIPTNYLNKYLISDFERSFSRSQLTSKVNLEPFGSKYARWSRAFLGVPGLREFLASYLWAVLSKDRRN